MAAKGQLVKVRGVGFVRVPPGSSNRVIQQAAESIIAAQKDLAKLQRHEVMLDGSYDEPVADPTTAVDNPDVKGILDLIRTTETNLGYNQIVGHNRTLPLDEMSIDDIMAYQKKEMTKAKGYESSAVGGYQIIRDTLGYLKRRMKLSGDELLTKEMQDDMALELLGRRGLSRWESGEISDEEFATNIAKEWASFPVVKPVNGKRAGESYHKHVGTNKALVSIESVLNTLEAQRNRPYILDKELDDQLAEKEFEVPTPDLADSLMEQEQASGQLSPEPIQPQAEVPNASPAAPEKVSQGPKSLDQAALDSIPEDLVSSAFPDGGNPTLAGQGEDKVPSLDEKILLTQGIQQ